MSNCVAASAGLALLVMLSAHVEQNKINSVLATIYFISAPHVRTALLL